MFPFRLLLIEPPGSFVLLCTALAILVIVSVRSGELHTIEVVILGASDAVTSSSRVTSDVEQVTLVLSLNSKLLSSSGQGPGWLKVR